MMIHQLWTVFLHVHSVVFRKVSHMDSFGLTLLFILILMERDNQIKFT